MACRKCFDFREYIDTQEVGRPGRPVMETTLKTGTWDHGTYLFLTDMFGRLS